MPSRTPMIAPVAALLLAAPGAALAHDFFFKANLTPEQVVPPTSSSAFGHALLAYDHHGSGFDLLLEIRGITIDDLYPGGPNGNSAHLHAAPVGQNGPIVFDLQWSAGFVQDGDVLRMQFNNILLGGQQGAHFADELANETSLYDGLMYVQIMTDAFPDGEIRGQFELIPAPAALHVLAFAALGAAHRRRR